jgi:hypothetical protein
LRCAAQANWAAGEAKCPLAAIVGDKTLFEKKPDAELISTTETFADKTATPEMEEK